MNIDNIPQHCIEYFTKRFASYPSILKIEVEVEKEKLDKFFSKSHKLWIRNFYDGKKITEKEKFLEYDSSGIMVYINESFEVFMLTTIDRLNVAEFTIHNLNKIK